MKTLIGIAAAVTLLAAAGAEALDLRSWDQQMTGARFLVLSNFGGHAVMDKETQLLWQKAPASNATGWGAAINACEGQGTGGRRGWRLPTTPELMSLVDLTVGLTDNLPPGHPFVGVAGASYWTATVDAFEPLDKAMYVDMALGYSQSDVTNGASHRFWCVRGRR